MEATETVRELVSMEVIEGIKENVQPLRRGRNAAALVAAISSPVTLEDAERMRQEHEEKILRSEGSEDPLASWISYLTWTEETYPSGGSPAKLLPLLERCTRHFCKDPRYKNNLKYLEIWLKYAGYCDDPIDIYTYLHSHGIGEDLADFYEAYGECLEAKKRFQEADKLYLLGTNRGAQPLERLRRHHLDFTLRIFQQAEVPESTSQDENRTGLKFKKKGTPENTGLQHATQAPPTQRSTTSHTSNASNASNTKSKLTIWSDDGASDENVPTAVPPRAMLPTQADTVKENSQAPGTWGTAASGLRGSSSAPSNKPPIFVDEECKEQEAEPINPAPKRPLRMVLESKDTFTEQETAFAEKLMKTPLMNFGEGQIPPPEGASIRLPVAAPLTAVPAAAQKSAEVSSAGPQPGVALPAPAKAKGTKDKAPKEEGVAVVEKRIYDLSLIYTDQEEFSFEEIRARSRRYQALMPLTADNPPANPVPDVPFDPARIRHFVPDSVVPLREDKGKENPQIPTGSCAHLPLSRERTLDSPVLGELSLLPDQMDEDAMDGVYFRADSMSEFVPKHSLDLSFDVFEDPEEEQLAEPGYESPLLHRKTLFASGGSTPLFAESEMVVDPFDLHLRHTLLQGVEVPILVHQSPRGSDTSVVELGGLQYKVQAVLGQGAFATVLLVSWVSGTGVKPHPGFFALKVQRESIVWEYRMCSEVQRRVSPSLTSKFCGAHHAEIFQDKSYILLEHLPGRSLLDLVNAYGASNKPIPEPLAIFYTIELLKIVEALHDADIIHADLKPEHLVIQTHRQSLSELSSRYQRDGSQGWGNLSLKILDFGRSIDLSLLPEHTRFSTPPNQSDAFNIIDTIHRKQQPWKFEIDYYGVCGIIHTLLHGSYLELSQEDGIWTPRAPLKRYWQTDLWAGLFRSLLNVSREQPRVKLAAWRQKLEVYLEVGYSHKSPSLKDLLREQEDLMGSL